MATAATKQWQDAGDCFDDGDTADDVTATAMWRQYESMEQSTSI